MKVRWVPSHSGIEENELADLEAKRGAMVTFSEEPKFSWGALVKWNARQVTLARENWWKQFIPRIYITSILETPQTFLKNFS